MSRRKAVTPLVISFIIILLCSCSLPKYTTVRSTQPPNYYLGESPDVRVVNAEGATRRMQDMAIQALRNQSRSDGHFTIKNRINEGIRFDTRGGRMVMTGKNISVSEEDVFIKFNVVASMKRDGRTTITRRTGVLGTETKEVPAVVTVMPVAFTVAKGDEVLLNERQYNGRAVWTITQSGGGYPNYRRRMETAVKKAVDKFLEDVTPRTVSRRIRLDYSDEQQKPILDVARNGQVKQAALQMDEYVQNHPNSSSAYYNLAVLTDAMGQYEQAIEYYNEALSLGGKDYYTEVKASCQQRLQEQRELEGSSSASDARQQDPLGNSSQPLSGATPQPDTSSQPDISQDGEQPGDGGDDVEWVQKTLNRLGHACGPEDGIMGPNTRSCIRSFQKAHDLDVTGTVNPTTYREVLKEIEPTREQQGDEESIGEQKPGSQSPSQTSSESQTHTQSEAEEEEEAESRSVAGKSQPEQDRPEMRSQAAPTPRSRVGVRIGRDFSDIEKFFVGVDALYRSPRLPALLYPALDYYYLGKSSASGLFTSVTVSVHILQLDGNVLYPLRVGPSTLKPYVGGGLAINLLTAVAQASGTFGGTSSASETDAGLGVNFVGGANYQINREMQFFAEAEYTPGTGIGGAGELSFFSIKSGVRFSF